MKIDPSEIESIDDESQKSEPSIQPRSTTQKAPPSADIKMPDVSSSKPLPTTDQTDVPSEEKPIQPSTDQVSPPEQKPETPPVDQKTLENAFRKYMGSSYDPNSSMDKGKMETVKKALEDFQKQNNKPFDINDTEDLTKMRSIMNAAYQSKEYKQIAGQPSKSSTVQKPSAQQIATSPASPKGGPTYYVRTGFNRYVPAVNADISSGQQLFMQNPNKALRAVYPYVKVESRPVRRATPAA